MSFPALFLHFYNPMPTSKAEKQMSVVCVSSADGSSVPFLNSSVCINIQYLFEGEGGMELRKCFNIHDYHV